MRKIKKNKYIQWEGQEKREKHAKEESEINSERNGEMHAPKRRNVQRGSEWETQKKNEREIKKDKEIEHEMKREI